MHKQLILTLLLLSVVLLTACTNTGNPAPGIPPATTAGSTPSTSQPTQSASRTLPIGTVKSHNAGNVTLDVRLQEVREDSILFKVAMNTHSVDLDPYDLSSSSYLSDDKDNKYSPLGWKSAPGRHHREGDLVFPLPPSVSAGETA